MLSLLTKRGEMWSWVTSNQCSQSEITRCTSVAMNQKIQTRMLLFLLFLIKHNSTLHKCVCVMIVTEWSGKTMQKFEKNKVSFLPYVFLVVPCHFFLPWNKNLIWLPVFVESAPSCIRCCSAKLVNFKMTKWGESSDFCGCGASH